MIDPHFIRGRYLGIALLEMGDFFTDILWLVSVVSLEAFQTNDYDEDNQDDGDRYGNIGTTRRAYFNVIYLFTVFFFLFASILLVCKISDDLKGILATNPGEHKPYKKMEIFGVSLFFLLTMPSNEVAELYQQQQQEQKADKSHVIDDIVGINRPDNYLDWEVPSLSDILLPSLGSDGDLPIKLMDALCYPITLTYSSAYFSRLAWFAVLIWPMSFVISILSMGSAFNIGVANLFSKSKHAYTIRMFEDIPQLTVNIVYLFSPFGKGAANYANILTMTMSTIMLMKFAFEVIYKAMTTNNNCQLIRRQIALPASPSAMHVIYATCVSPFIGIAVSSVLLLAIFMEALFSGLMMAVSTICGNCNCGKSSEQDADLVPLV